MNLNERISSMYLESLYKDDCFFKVIPSELGTIVYCNTSNPNRAPYARIEKIKRVSLFLSICILVVSLSFIIFQKFLVWNIILTIGVGIISIWYLRKVLIFKGVDYFVGENGFSILKFRGHRDNIVENKTFLFSNISQLLTSETYKRVNYNYAGTDYCFAFFDTVDAESKTNLVFEYVGEYHQENPKDEIYNDDYLFFRKVETQWTLYLWEKIKSSFIKPIFYILIFNKDKDKWESIPYVTFDKDKILVGNRAYDYETIKDIYFKEGTLVIEHINHSKKWFGLKEEGDIEHIPMSNLGNKKLFHLFLSAYIAKEGKNAI